MKIALVGYGKMGKAIEAIAIEKGHEIVLKIDLANQADLDAEHLEKADVAIEFTGPESAFGNIITCLNAGLPVVSGSTGWLDKLQEVEALVNEKQGTFLYASNFSIGVNIFFALNKRLAELMAPHPEYDIRLKEIHHTQKKDAPSGTAISLAEQIIRQHPVKRQWVNRLSAAPAELGIISERTDPAPGTHIVRYDSEIDSIEISHTAHSRKGFASGAVLAAEYLVGKKGVYSMSDVLGL